MPHAPENAPPRPIQRLCGHPAVIVLGTLVVGLLIAARPPRPTVAIESDHDEPRADQSHTTLRAWDAQPGDGFGRSIALGDRWLLVGAPHDDLAGRDSGSAALYALEDAAWEQVDLIAPARGAPRMHFGHSVALEGDLCAVGAPGAGSRGRLSGTVYLFRRDGDYWLQIAELRAATGTAGDRFGEAIALDRGRLLVGAPGTDGAAPDSGAVHIYEAEEGRWLERKVLSPPTGSGRAEFGCAVDLDGDRIAIGAWGLGPKDLRQGGVFLYLAVEGRWEFEAKLTAPDSAILDYFGTSIDLSGERCLVGAPWKKIFHEGVGAAHLFQRVQGEWREEALLLGADRHAGAGFGTAVALENGRALVGARFGAGPPDARHGSVECFQHGPRGWERTNSLPRPPGTRADDYGMAIELAGDQVAIGAPCLAAGGHPTQSGSVTHSWLNGAP